MVPTRDVVLFPGEGGTINRFDPVHCGWLNPITLPELAGLALRLAVADPRGGRIVVAPARPERQAEAGRGAADPRIADPRVASIWRLSDDTDRATFERVLVGHFRDVVAAAFSETGTHLVTGGEDRRAILWETDSGAAKAPLEGHSQPIRSVRFAARDSLILTGSQDGTVRVWSGETGRQLVEWRAYDGSVVGGVDAVDFADPTNEILAGGFRAVKVWRLPVRASGLDLVRAVACFVPWRAQGLGLVPHPTDPSACDRYWVRGAS